jgi:hypothetical protein
VHPPVVRWRHAEGPRKRPVEGRLGIETRVQRQVEKVVLPALAKRPGDVFAAQAVDEDGEIFAKPQIQCPRQMAPVGADQAGKLADAELGVVVPAMVADCGSPDCRLCLPIAFRWGDRNRCW